MQASVEAREPPGRAGTWPTAGAAAPVFPSGEASPASASMYAVLDAPSAVQAFEACCRALSHKANTALVAQLPLLQRGAVIDLSRNYIGAAGLQAIAVVLPLNPNVTELRAPRNGLTNDAVVLFCRAMRRHAHLAVLDFSFNTDISLAGGLALLSLAQQLPSLRAVCLEGTHVPPAVLGKLQRALDANAVRSAPAVPQTGQVATTITTTTSSFSPASARGFFLPFRPTTASKDASPTGSDEEGQEDRQLMSALEARVRAAMEDGYQLPLAVPLTGWRVLEVPILAPPFLFETEIELLCTDVFPRLNEEFAPHRLVLCPVVVVGAAPNPAKNGAEANTASLHSPARSGRAQTVPRTIGSYSRELHFLPVCDVTAAVARGRFAAIELIGDRPGDYAQVSAAAMLSLQQHFANASTHESHTSRETTTGKDSESDDGAAAPADLGELRPVLYEAHEAALRSTQWLLVATRRETRSLQVPAALAPLLTADPSIAHPDRHRTVARDIVYDDALGTTDADTLRGLTTTVTHTLEWDYAAEEQQWRRHLAWRRHVASSAPVKELVISQYSATFDCMDAAGAVRLKGLEAFQRRVYQRLRTIVRTCLTALLDADNDEMAASDVGGDLQSIYRRMGLLKVWSSAFIQSVAAFGSGATKKNIMNRIVLYAANPPSRNSLLLHGEDATALATLICRAVSRLQSLQHAYTLAFYSARSNAVVEEPDDVRSFVVYVVSQLTTDAAVLRYVHAEVDTERLCAFCMQVLSGTVRATAKAAAIVAVGLPPHVAQYTLDGTVAGAEGGIQDEGQLNTTAPTAAAARAFVVVVDGIDKFVPPVRPCGALVLPTQDGGSAGNRAEPASWSDDGTGDNTGRATQAFATSSTVATANPLEALLPRALARNVRLIAGCDTGSTVFNALRRLGRDSVEALGLGPASVNEVEQFLSPATLSRHGLTFSEDDFECARAKKDAATGEYVRYLQDAARCAQEAPGFLTQSQVIQAFPPTTAEAAQGVYDRLINAFGLPLTRSVLGFLTTSRWGLTVPELRALLPQLSACHLQELLRVLRPVVEPEMPQEACVMMGPASGNAQLGNVRIVVQSFLDVVHREALQAVTDEQQIDADQRVWHGQLAQYYLSIVYRCLSAGKTDKRDARQNLEDGTVAGLSRTPLGSPELLAEQRRAMKEVIYHMAHSGAFWPQLDATVLSLPFLQQVYQLGLGYAYLRDLTAAFNERYQRHLLGEDIGEASWQHTQPSVAEGGCLEAVSASTSSGGGAVAATAGASRYALPAVLSRMRDYVRFAHDHGLLLSLRPSLVTQMALQIPASALNSVQRDTVTFLYRQQQHGSSLRQALYFTVSTTAALVGKGAATHLGPVTCAAYLPNRKFIVTASRDRSLAWVNPQSGSVAWHARQPTAPVVSLTVCRTSAYVAAVSEDRTVWIYDGLQGKLVTQCRGGEWFDAPIASVVFSARGRYIWVVTTDTRARCFECETGHMRCTLGVPELLPPQTQEPQRRRSAEGDASNDDGASRKDDTEKGAPQHDGTPEWRHKRTYLAVLPDAEEDEACTTVTGLEVRQWQLYPWKTAPPSEPAPLSACSEGKSRETRMAFDMTCRCRLLPAGTAAADEETSAPASTQPEGYKWMVPWEPATSQFSQTRRSAYAFALPARRSSEVHLLVLPLEALNGKTTAAAVRCAFPSPIPDDEVTVVCASPDDQWLAVGMGSGKIGLFNINSAVHEGTERQPQWTPSAAPVACMPACIYTSLMPVEGMTSAPICSLAFHRSSQLLFALGRSLKCWRVPHEGASAVAKEASSRDVGEHVWAQVPTCLTVLPPPATPSSDVELPSNVAELCVGDETGRLSLLKLWKPDY
ncbi:hypothetical protein NQL31_007843 [Lotmaria passim]